MLSLFKNHWRWCVSWRNWWKLENQRTSLKNRDREKDREGVHDAWNVSIGQTLNIFSFHPHTCQVLCGLRFLRSQGKPQLNWVVWLFHHCYFYCFVIGFPFFHIVYVFIFIFYPLFFLSFFFFLLLFFNWLFLWLEKSNSAYNGTITSNRVLWASYRPGTSCK